MTSNIHFTSALEDFRKARRQATLKSILTWMRGKRQEELLPYEAVRRKLQAIETADRKLEDIRITSIVGSINRYTDFTRDFLPKKSISAERWARVKAASSDMAGLPPIEVYQIGEVYFVQDGNHRVSIARQSGASSIQAYVRRVQSRIPLTPDITPDELIIKSEYIDFLNATKIDEFRPHTDLNTTSPGGFPFMLQQIEAVQFAIEQRKDEKVSMEEAVQYWHDRIYLPIVSIVRENKLLSDFPHRTETDLFIWLVRYQRELVNELGWEISFDTAARMIQSTLSQKMKQKFMDFWDKLLPEKIKPSPRVGDWRKQQLAAKQGRLFAEILVLINGQEKGWNVMDFGCDIAREEGSQIYGLHIRSNRTHLNKEEVQSMNNKFNQYSESYGVYGKLVFESTGRPNQLILKRAHIADLVVLPMKHSKMERKSGLLDSLIHRCPTPIFIVHENACIPIKKGLLAYNQSPKAEEALFLATYLAKFREIPLVVLTVIDQKETKNQALAIAYDYLDRYNIEAEFIKASGPPGVAVTTLAQETQCDLIITGGYGTSPLKKLFTGSAIDEIIRNTQQSILICK